MDMISDEDGKLRAVLSARLTQLAFSLVRNGTVETLPRAVNSELARLREKLEPEDTDRYQRIAAIRVQIFLNIEDRERVRALRRQQAEAERYLGFSAAAEALHRAQSYEDFLRVLSQVNLGRTYSCSYSPISPFPLIWAMSARVNALQRVQAMLDAGVRLDLVTQPIGLTILHEMAMAGAKGWEKRLSLLQLLIKNGAKLEAQDFGGRTPLLCAIAEGSLDDLQLFLAAGADVRASTNNTPLMIAADSPAKMRLLLEHGADPSQRSADGQDLLGYLRQSLAQAESWLMEQPTKKRAGSTYEKRRDARAISLEVVRSFVGS
jgi:Ankyrin repeats (3 copies)